MDSSTSSGGSQFSVDLSRQFLVAMPGKVGGSLANTVIYVCEHTEQGALGLVINRPTDLTLGNLLERIDLDLSLEIGPVQNDPVFFGGPVQTDRGFVLHTPKGEYGSSIGLGDVELTTSRDVLQDIAQGHGPVHVLVTLGYAGWGAGQLENEMAGNAWLNTDASLKVMFETQPEARYDAALGLLGINSSMLTGDVGHD